MSNSGLSGSYNFTKNENGSPSDVTFITSTSLFSPKLRTTGGINVFGFRFSRTNLASCSLPSSESAFVNDIFNSVRSSDISEINILSLESYEPIKSLRKL